jgi:predicted phage terminase large subunit-like protein
MARELVLDEPGDELLRRVQAERGRRSLEYFVRFVRPEYDLQAFHVRLIAEIQRWADAPEPYPLVLSLPPGHGKSEYAKLACAWLLVRDPEQRVAYVSYGSDLAQAHFESLLEILGGEQAVQLYGELIPPEGKGGRTKEGAPALQGDGHLYARGREQGLTGLRIDTGVMDDLLKDDIEASSLSTREAAWRWITRVMRTRKRVGRPLRLLMLATRWHLDDPTGRALAKIRGAREVRFPALKEGGPTEQDPRSEGEALWPEQMSAEQLDEERELDPYGFAALWQQDPVPDGGAMIKATYLARRWESLDALQHAPGRWVQSWDCRNDGKDLKRSSQVAAHLYFEPLMEPANAYLIDKRGGPWSPEETLEQFDAAQLDPLWSRATIRLIEAKADGKMILSLRQRRYPGMTPITPTEDKVTRLRAVLPFLAALNVVLPQVAAWLGQVLSDLTAFPAALHDDDVDALTQYLAWRWVPALDKGGPPPNPLERLRARQGRKP